MLHQILQQIAAQTKPAALAGMKADAAYDNFYGIVILVCLVLVVVLELSGYNNWVGSWGSKKQDSSELSELTEAA